MEISEVILALSAAVAGGWFTYAVAVRNIYNNSVTQERRDWREKIRRLSANLAVELRENDGNREKYKLLDELRMRLNPGDRFDKIILDTDDPQELIRLVAILLKHDWERAKLESQLFKQYFFEVRKLNCLSEEEIKNFAKKDMILCSEKDRKIFKSKIKWCIVFPALLVILLFFPYLIANACEQIEWALEEWRQLLIAFRNFVCNSDPS